MVFTKKGYLLYCSLSCSIWRLGFSQKCEDFSQSIFLWIPIHFHDFVVNYLLSYGVRTIQWIKIGLNGFFDKIDKSKPKTLSGHYCFSSVQHNVRGGTYGGSCRFAASCHVYWQLAFVYIWHLINHRLMGDCTDIRTE